VKCVIVPSGQSPPSMLKLHDFCNRAVGETVIFGNPPVIGQDTRTEQQLEQMNAVWRRKNISRLDYVTCWHIKSLGLCSTRNGRFAFVTTNSITQGEQVPLLFGPIFAAGWRIRFAHRTFSWDSDAPGKASVHCVIVGFDRAHEPRPQLWDYPNVSSAPVAVPVERVINAYLVDGPNVLVQKMTSPISCEIKPAVLGAMAKDG